MFSKVLSRHLLVLFAVVSLGIAMGCGDAASNEDELFSDGPKKASGFTGFSDILSGFRYPNGLESIGTVLTDEQLITEYEKWKGWYVTESGAGDPNPADDIKYYRVKRDKASSNDTVSEGVAYGMLLALYFNDRETFDGLYRYCKLHFIDSETSLMHWKVRADGTDISEFRLAVPHGIPFTKISEWNLRDIDESGGPGTFRTYYVDKNDDATNFGNKNVANQVLDIATNPLYVRAAQWDRKLGSATDADVDIAAALCMASKRWWWTGSYNYTLEASKCIKSIIDWDVSFTGSGSTMSALLRNGSAWGKKPHCWNPSYFTPSWWKVFAKFIDTNKTNFDLYTNKKPTDPDYTVYLNKCNVVYNSMYVEMKKIDVANGTAGLFPDWCDTYTAGVVIKSEGKNYGSDRRYYLDDPLVSGSPDDRDGNGAIQYSSTPISSSYYYGSESYKNDMGQAADGYDKLSFNYYYDAIRVPWRLALDYSWYKNTDAKNMVRETANFFKAKITPTVTMVDGYSITGGNWNPADCDGFNNLTPDKYGGQWDSLTFRAMNATSTMAGDNTVPEDVAYAQNFYNLITAPATITDSSTPPVERTNHYYENTLRLLSLLYMSGKMVNYYDMDNLATFKYPRKPAQMKTVGPVTIDLAYADYGVYATTHLEFNDRAKLFNNDQTFYGKIGAGVKSGAGTDKMILGYMAYVGDVVCGLPTLWLRQTNLRDCSVLARGKIEGRAIYPVLQLQNMNKDPGCMDISVDASKFNPDMSKSKDVKQYDALFLTPGRYGDIKLNGKNKLYLSTGVYHFNSLNVEPDNIIYFDTTSGPVQVYVKNDVSIKSRTKMLQKDSTKGADPSKILFVVNTSNGVYLAPQINWRGTLIALNTSYLNVDMGNSDIRGLLKPRDPKKWETTTSGGEAYGAFIGKYVVVHQDTPVLTVPFDWASIK